MENDGAHAKRLAVRCRAPLVNMPKLIHDNPTLGSASSSVRTTGHRKWSKLTHTHTQLSMIKKSKEEVRTLKRKKRERERERERGEGIGG